MATYTTTRQVAAFLSIMTLAAGSAADARFDEEQMDDMARAFAPLHESEGGLTFTFTPGVWIPRLVGDAGLGPGDRFELRPDFGMDDREPTFNAELSIRKHERWELQLSGFHFSTDATSDAAMPMTFGSVVLAPGDRFRSAFEMTSISGELRISVFRPLPLPWTDDGRARNSTSTGEAIADLRFMPAFGARWISVRHEVEDFAMMPAKERVRGEWAIPYAGVMMELTFRPDGLPLTDDIRIEAGIGAGPALGSGSGFGWHVRAGLTWNFTRNVGVTVGYRLVDLSVEVDDYELRGGLQGLFAGGSLRF